MSGADLIAHALALAADPAFDPGYKQLSDFRAMTALAFGPDDIKRTASLSAFRPGTLRVTVVDSDVGFGMTRMYQAHVGGPPETLRVVRSSDEAWEVLGVPRDASARREGDALVASLRLSAE